MLEELVTKIKSYLAESISLSELEDWAASKLVSLISDPNSWEADLNAAIELSLAQFSYGLWDEEKVRKYLQDELNEYAVRSVYPRSDVVITTEASTNDVYRDYSYTTEAEDAFMVVVY